MSSSAEIEEAADFAEKHSRIAQKIGVRDEHGICCPECGSAAAMVKDSRPNTYGIRRRRMCAECKARWTTIEINTDSIAMGADLPQIRVVLAEASLMMSKLTKVIQALEDMSEIKARL